MDVVRVPSGTDITIKTNYTPLSCSFRKSLLIITVTHSSTFQKISELVKV